MEIERGRARLYFATMGQGPDLVLLHPTPVHHAFWLPVAEQLADRYRLILPDLRGHGQSVVGTQPAGQEMSITMETMAEDVHAVLEELGVSRAAFAGCSIGGYVLYEYWRRFSEQMSALIPICGKPQADASANREKRRAAMRLAEEPGGLEKYFDQAADTLVGATTRRLHPEIRAAARAMMDRVSLSSLLAVQRGLMERPDSVPTLRTIHVPVSVIAAEEDLTSTPEEMRVVAKSVPGAEFHLLPGTGHYAPLEQPEAVAGMLDDFLSSNPSQKLANPTSEDSDLDLQN